MDIAQQGQRIAELESELDVHARWVHPGSALAVASRKHQRDELKARLKSLETRRSYLAGEWKLVAEEVDSCATALDLMNGLFDGTSDGRRTTGSQRLRKRLVFRANEAIELQRDVSGIDRKIWRISIEIEQVQATLIDILTSSLGTAQAVSVQRRTQQRGSMRARLKALMSVDSKVMWSPSPVIGYRVWSLTSAGFAGSRDPWSTSRFTATCDLGGDVPHTDGRCADVAFGCGVYVAKDVRELLGEFDVVGRLNVAVGLVLLRGKVVEHERGYRAETTQVVSLVVLGKGWLTIVEGADNVAEAFLSSGDRCDLVGYKERKPVGNDEIEEELVRFFDRQAEEFATWI